MHYAAMPKFHLSKLHPGMKVLLTLYLLSVLVALAVSVLMYTTRADLSWYGAVRHYQGDDAIPAEVLERMDADSEELTIALPMSGRRVVEILHPHLFTIPLVLLVVCHLFALTRTPMPLKIACYVGSFGGFLLIFGGMWLATRSELGIVLLALGAAAFFVTTAWMPIASIAAAWLGRGPDEHR